MDKIRWVSMFCQGYRFNLCGNIELGNLLVQPSGHFTGEELQVKFLSDSGEISLKY